MLFSLTSPESPAAPGIQQEETGISVYLLAVPGSDDLNCWPILAAVKRRGEEEEFGLEWAWKRMAVLQWWPHRQGSLGVRESWDLESRSIFIPYGGGPGERKRCPFYSTKYRKQARLVLAAAVSPQHEPFHSCR